MSEKIIKFFDRVPKEYHHDSIFRGYAQFRQRRHQMQEAAEKKGRKTKSTAEHPK